MKINLSELSAKGFDDWKYSLIMEVLTQHTRDVRDWKPIFGIEFSSGSVEVDVVMTINGVEVPFDSFVKMLEDNYERAVKEAAIQLVKEKFGSLNNVLYDMERIAKNFLRDM